MKITDLISGYDTMSPEEQAKAIAEFDYQPPVDLSEELKKSKDQVSAYSSQIAEYKRKERESLSDAEKKQAEADERFKELETKYNELMAENKVSTYTAKFVALGYDETAARESAKALASGDADSLFASIAGSMKSLEKSIKAEMTKMTQPPSDKGTSSSSMTKEKFRKLSPAERSAYAMEHPDEYKKLYGE